MNNNKAIARIVPIYDLNDTREPFYAATVRELSHSWEGLDDKGEGYLCNKPHWKVEMLHDEWNGEGLPPVGTECECSVAGDPYLPTKVAAITVNMIIITNNSDSKEDAFYHDQVQFRPIRSARDKAVDKIKELLMYDYGDDPRVNDAIFIYDAIAAGKIPGVKLDN